MAIIALTTIHNSFWYKWIGTIGLYKIANNPNIQANKISFSFRRIKMKNKEQPHTTNRDRE